jgi:hypothetical protein
MATRPVTDGGEHLRPGQHQLDRAVHDPGREHSQGRVWPDAESRPEPASHIRSEHPYVVLRHVEDGGEGLARQRRPLAWFMDGKPVAFPTGHGGKEPKWVVGLRAEGERLVVDHVG